MKSMTTPPKSEKWERRRARQEFLNRCASLKKTQPLLTALTARKIWDRALADAARFVAQK
jgi:hypothetical protein